MSEHSLDTLTQRLDRLERENRWWKITAIIVAASTGMILAGCGPTTSELLQRHIQEIDSLWSPMEAATGYATEMERQRQIRLRSIAPKYGYAFDEFDAAGFAFNLAVYERLDRNQISKADARFLIAEYWRRLQVQREQLWAARQQSEAAYWSIFSHSMNQMGQAVQQWQQQQYPLQVMPRMPIQCTTQVVGTTALTNCY